MFRKAITPIIFFCTVILAWANEQQIISLTTGSNEVLVKVQNTSELNFFSLKLETKQEKLPEGIIVSSPSEQVDIYANQVSKTGLYLAINVDEQVKEGFYEIPLVLKDGENHSWHFTLTTQLNDKKPKNFDLEQNYPNPFNSNTQIKYTLATNEEVHTQLIIYDVLGQKICTLVDEKQPAGAYQVVWNGTNSTGNLVSNGTYFYKLISGSFVKVQKMTLLK